MIWLTVIKALLVLVPLITRLVNEGRIKEGARNEVIAALKENFNERVVAAERARDTPHDPGMPDPNDRANRQGG